MTENFELVEKDNAAAFSQDKLEENKPVDWDGCRKQSLEPGGFGDKRAEIWPTLLHAHRRRGTFDSIKIRQGRNLEPFQKKDDQLNDAKEKEKHPDERQIKLDTDRSFVHYPKVALSKREEMQRELNELLVAFFRRRPRLNYFQGFHDIATVLFLTLPPELHFSCLEQISLQRLRDSMGAGLEPLVGQLRVLKRILRAADEPYSEFLEQVSPLPYHALSNLLTLFSHDVPTLPLVQRVFDFLLSRPPVCAIYLAAATILSRKGDVKRLEENNEEGMVHSLLSSLPDLEDTNNDIRQASADLKNSVGSLAANSPAEGTEESDVVQNLTFEVENSVPSPSEGSTMVHQDESDETIQGDASLDGSFPADQLSVTSEPDATLVDESETTPHEEKKSEEDAEWVPRKPTNSNLGISLSQLLSHADELFELYPPTHPSIGLDSIFGPQSVMFTWSERRRDMPSSDEAEKMNGIPELIVRPEPKENVKDGRDGNTSESESDAKGKKRGKRRKSRKTAKKAGPSLSGQIGSRHAMVASAVLALGVAVAVYGMRPKPPEGRHEFGKVWGRIGSWVGSVAEKLVQHGDYTS